MSYSSDKQLSRLNVLLLTWSLYILVLMGAVVFSRGDLAISFGLYSFAFAALVLTNRRFVHILMLLSLASIFSFFAFVILFGFEGESVLSTIAPDGIRFANLLLWSMLVFFMTKISGFHHNDSIRTVIREMRYYLLLVVFAFTSLIWTMSMEYSLREGLKLLYPVFTFLIALIILRKHNNVGYFSHFLRKMLILAILLNIVGMLYKLYSGTLFITGGRTGITRMTDLPIDMTICMFSGIFFFSYFCFSKKIRYLLLSVMVLCLLVPTITRSYIAGYIASILYIAAFSNRKLFPKISVLVLFLFLIYVFFEIDNPLKSRMFLNPKAIGLADVISKPQILLRSDVVWFTGRNNMWKSVIDGLHSSASSRIGGGIGTLIGGGAGTSKYFLYHQFKSPGYVHSDWIKYFSELGYIGLFLYLLFLLSLLLRSTRLALSRSNPQSQTYFATTSGTIVFCLVAGIGYEVLSPITLFYILMFYAIGLITVSRSPLRPS